MKTIKLTKGYEAIVDDEDFAEVSKYKWCLSVTGKKKKHISAMNSKVGRLSRFIAKPGIGQITDHRDHNTLDNRRGNLRNCTKVENSQNMEMSHNKNGYKGVLRIRKDRPVPCRGRLRIGKKCIMGHARYHAVLAAKDYDDLAKKHFKEFAYLNFPHSIRREHIARMIMSTNGRIFKITFIKRTGEQEERTILGRVGVKKHLKSVGCRYSPEKAKLVVIFDMQDRQYKAVPIEGIHAFYFGGKKYRVD
jgi:hypothetical protein